MLPLSRHQVLTGIAATSLVAGVAYSLSTLVRAPAPATGTPRPSYVVLARGMSHARDIAVPAKGAMLVAFNDGVLRKMATDKETAAGVPAGAQVESPVHLQLDGNGNLYVEDTVNLHGGCIPNTVIRRIAPDGNFQTLTAQGYRSGQASQISAMEFDRLPGMVAEQDGTIYLVGPQSDILKVSPLGKVSKLFDAATAAIKANGDPWGFGALAMHPDGSLVAVDYGQVVYKIARNGALTRLAGVQAGCEMRDGPATQAAFCEANSIAVSQTGDVYVLDRGCDVRKIARDGAVSTLISPAGSGRPTALTYEAGLCPFESIVLGREGDIYLAGTSIVRFHQPDGARVAALPNRKTN